MQDEADNASPGRGRGPRIAMIAGEASGDILGGGLVRSLKARFPDASFEGIGGPTMLEQGFESHVPMERLSVMGLVEVLGRLFELLGVRKRLAERWIADPPDVFVGIDAPDFNLGLERKLKEVGIPTVHYCSPSVWAWRQGRVEKIHRSVDLMLTLFPFEARFYEEHNVPVRFVGHPLADTIPMDSWQEKARAELGLDAGARIVALLPGSRGAEIKYLGRTFFDTARWCLQHEPGLQFLLPAANETRRAQLETIMAEVAPDLPIRILDGQSRLAMAASDVVLLASGTATLEAMLLKRPMVIAYRVNFITFLLAKLLVKSAFISLPNNLAGRELAPEILQHDATPEKLGAAVMERLQNRGLVEQLSEDYRNIHDRLRRNASESAADAVAELLRERRGLTPLPQAADPA